MTEAQIIQPVSRILSYTSLEHMKRFLLYQSITLFMACFGGCFQCGEVTGGFLGPAQVILDDEGRFHVAAAYWAHTGYSPAYKSIRYGVLDDDTLTVSSEDLFMSGDLQPHGFLLDGAGNPMLVNGQSTRIDLLTLSRGRWQKIEAAPAGLIQPDQLGPSSYKSANAWLGDDGVIRILLPAVPPITLVVEVAGGSSRRVYQADIPAGYQSTVHFSTSSGKNPLWLFKVVGEEPAVYVPARIECGTDCTWEVNETRRISPESPLSIDAVLGQTTDGTPVTLDSVAAQDPVTDDFTFFVEVSWPGDHEVFELIDSYREHASLAARPSGGFVAAVLEGRQNCLIHLFVFDGDYGSTTFQMEVESSYIERLEILVENDPALGELAHVFYSDEDRIVQESVVLSTLDRTTGVLDLE